jgi:hypothetical protein
VLLDEVPGTSGTRSAHRAFEAEYLARYRAVAAACLRPDDPALDVVVQVLSGAVEGVIHKAARNNSLKSPAMKQELVTLIRSYLLQAARL